MILLLLSTFSDSYKNNMIILVKPIMGSIITLALYSVWQKNCALKNIVSIETLMHAHKACHSMTVTQFKDITSTKFSLSNDISNEV